MKKIGAKKIKKEKTVFKNLKLTKKDIKASKNKNINKIIDKPKKEISKKSDTMISLSKDEEEEKNDNKYVYLTTTNYDNVMSDFLKIKGCSILKYGIKISTDKINFGYCRTCDENLIYPMCIECTRQCHQELGHTIIEMNEPANIRCGCGEKMHKITIHRRNSKLLTSKECPYSDLCEKSRLSTLYVIEGKCVCEFCYRMCGYDGRGQPLEKEK